MNTLLIIIITQTLTFSENILGNGFVGLDNVSSDRRRLATPSSHPTTGAPSASKIPSRSPSRSPVTKAPTAPLYSVNPSVSPVSASVPSKTPTVSTTSTTTTATSTTTVDPVTPSATPTLVEVIQKSDESSNFVGFDMSSSRDVGLFSGILSLVLIVVLVLAAPFCYRRYYESRRNAKVDPQVVLASQAQVAATLASVKKALKQGSSFLSEDDLEVPPVRSEDKIRMAEPCE